MQPVDLTGLQLSILHVLWDEGEATTRRVWEVLNADRTLALTTVATLLSRLERKEVLTHRRAGRRYVYRAIVTRTEVRRRQLRELTEALFDGDPASLVEHLVGGEPIRPAALERMRAALETEANGGRSSSDG